MYVSFCGASCLIFGRTSAARDEVEEAPVVVCSVRMVVLWAIHALLRLAGE